MQRVDADLGDVTADLDGEGTVVLRLDAPSDLTDVAPETFVLATPDNETVRAEGVTANANQLVVRFDDAAVSELADGATSLDLFGEYDSSEFEFVYFENARLTADVQVGDATGGADEGGESDESEESEGDGDGSEDAGASTDAYQIDVVAGEVIETLGDDADDFYAAQGRLLQAQTVLADGTVTGTYMLPAENVTKTLAGHSVTYTPVSYDGDTGEVTLTVSVGEGAGDGVTLSVAGYELPGDDTTFVRANADGQELVAARTVTLEPGQSGTVTVDLTDDEDDES
jgi:hypothetical protein